MNLISKQKIIGMLTILSGLVAIASMTATFMAVNYDAAVLSDPLMILALKNTSAEAAKWAMVLDMFGYYLLLLPVIYLMHDWMKDKSPWSNLVTFCGWAYVLVGSIGASILAVIWPKIMKAYPLASIAEQQILKANFSLINDVVYAGMWNLLEMVFASVWWMIIGFILLRERFRLIGWLTCFMGIACVGDAISGIFGLSALHEISLNAYLMLAIVWAIGMGIFLMKKPFRMN